MITYSKMNTLAGWYSMFANQLAVIAVANNLNTWEDKGFEKCVEILNNTAPLN